MEIQIKTNNNLPDGEFKAAEFLKRLQYWDLLEWIQ